MFLLLNYPSTGGGVGLGSKTGFQLGHFFPANIPFHSRFSPCRKKRYMDLTGNLLGLSAIGLHGKG